MINYSVCFSGYRPNKYDFTNGNKKSIYQKLLCEIVSCIKYRYYTNYFGAAPGFDLLAAYAVIYLKRAFDIKLICTLPYESFYLSNEFDENWRKDYLSVIKRCDEVINVSEKKEKGGMFI